MIQTSKCSDNGQNRDMSNNQSLTVLSLWAGSYGVTLVFTTKAAINIK